MKFQTEVHQSPSWLIGFLCQVIISGQNPGPGCLWPHAGVLLSYFLDICNPWVNVIATMMTLWQLSITRPSVWCTARMSRLQESGVSDLFHIIMKKLHHQLSVIIHNQQNRHHFSCEGDIQPHDCPKGTFFEVKKEMKMRMLENKNHLTGKQDVWLLSSLCCLPWVRSALRWLRRWGELSYLLVIVCVCVYT